MHRSGPARLVTFSLFTTDVPGDISEELNVIRCVWLDVHRGYGLQGYYSEPVRIRSTD